MRSTVEVLEDNKVKVVVEVEEAEFEKDLDAAFKKLAKEIRLPGFRPGKAPRKVLEARIGGSYARDEAFRDALPGYYSQAVTEHAVDVIAPPEIDITDGQESGPVLFDAVVEIRPSITISGYEGLEVTVDAPTIEDADVDQAIDRMRAGFGELQEVDRPGRDGDRAVIDIETLHEDELVEGLSVDGYVYEIGSGAAGIPEIDEALRGAEAGEELGINADHPDEDEIESLEITIQVNEIQEMVLPEPTDQWVADNSEFETLDELRDDIRKRLLTTRVMSTQAQRENGIGEALVALVDDDQVPAAMIDSELQSRIEDIAHRLHHQGMEMEQYLAMTGQTQQDMIASMRADAMSSAKADLALRAIATEQHLEVAESDVDDTASEVAERASRPVDKIRADLEASGAMLSLRSQLLKGKALEWVTERIKLIDTDGLPVPADALELPQDDTAEDDTDDTDESGENDQ